MLAIDIFLNSVLFGVHKGWSHVQMSCLHWKSWSICLALTVACG